MKSASIVYLQNHQSPWAKSFGDGLKKHGWTVALGHSPQPANLLVVWGVRNQSAIGAQLGSGGKVCVIERGYLGDRFSWSSVSFGGGLNGRGIFRGPFDDAGRWDAHFKTLMQPWRAPGDGYALLLGQVQGDMSLKGVDIAKFWTGSAAKLSAMGFKVKFRDHPLARAPVIGLDVLPRGRTLADDLAGASMAVTWNSNAAVDAVLAGVPTITADRGSMAWDVTGHTMAAAPTPDRTAWAHALAWKQWRLEEMANGECWARVGADHV